MNKQKYLDAAATLRKAAETAETPSLREAYEWGAWHCEQVARKKGEWNEEKHETSIDFELGKFTVAVADGTPEQQIAELHASAEKLERDASAAAGEYNGLEFAVFTFAAQILRQYARIIAEVRP